VSSYYLSVFSAFICKVHNTKGGDFYMLSKKILVPVFAIVVSGATLFGVTQAVHAQGGNASYAGLVQAIAQKFGLDKSQVQSVFDQYRGGRQKKRLDQLVQQGKITAAQEQAILDEITKLKNEYNPNSFKNMTSDQRKQAFQNLQNEVKTWAQSQGIDLKYLMPFGGMRFGMRWLHHNNPMTTPTPTP
jgi:competence protein ComGC